MSRRFDRALEAATDQTLVEPNWEGILECVDMIRGSDVGVKQAVQSIQKRYHNENPHVSHHALLVLEACVKNCGKKFHAEIASAEFTDDLKTLVITNTPDKVKNKILELIQCWSSAFANNPEYRSITDLYGYLKIYGFEFPKLKEADAMFMADSAPEWADGENCYRCRVEFGVFTRKHHCRSCGQIFCDRCSNRQMFLPRFGIEKKVRVCETCFSKSSEDSTQKAVEKITQNGQQSNGKDTSAEEARQRELKEQEELDLALAISMSEAEEKNRKTGLYHQLDSNSSAPSKKETKPTNGPAASSDYPYIYRGVATESSLPVGADEEDDIDPALSRYLDKRYWEQRQAARDAESVSTLNNPNIRATAPPRSEMSFSTSSGDPIHSEYVYPSYNAASSSGQLNTVTNGYALNETPTNIEQKMAGISLAPSDEAEQTAAFCKALREQVEIMDNRMRSNLMRGRSIVNDSAIHALFNQLTTRHADVLTRMNNLDKEREHYEGLQDKLGYIEEARQALKSLRDEHAKERQERLKEEQRLRMQQMQVKLEQIRHKKYESLLEQRQIALQRLQEEELRLQQSRQQVVSMPQHPPNIPYQQPQPQQFAHPQPFVAQPSQTFYQHPGTQFQPPQFVPHPALPIQQYQPYPNPQIQPTQQIVQQANNVQPQATPEEEPLIVFD